MKRASAFLLAPLVLALLAVLAPACSGDHHHGRGGESGGASGGSTGSDQACMQYTTCGTCTPVDGCGWCSFPGATGSCVSDPDQCDTSQVFGWTWEPSGCSVGADAGVGPVADAGSPIPVDAALPIDATPEPSNDSATPDAPAAD